MTIKDYANKDYAKNATTHQWKFFGQPGPDQVSWRCAKCSVYGWSIDQDKSPSWAFFSCNEHMMRKSLK